MSPCWPSSMSKSKNAGKQGTKWHKATGKPSIGLKCLKLKNFVISPAQVNNTLQQLPMRSYFSFRVTNIRLELKEVRKK